MINYKDYKIKANVIGIEDDIVKLSSIFSKTIDTKKAPLPLDVNTIITIFLKEHRIQIEGIGKIGNIRIPIYVDIGEEKTSISLKANEIKASDVLNLTHNIKDKVLSEWINDRVKCEMYILNKLYIELDEKFNLKKEKIELDSYCSQTIVNYHDKTEPVFAQLTNITIKNQDLGFSFLRPRTKNFRIDNSKVYITNLFDKPVLKVIIKSKNVKFNKSVKSILKAYDISVPITQLSSSSRVEVNITSPLEGSSTDISADISAKKSRFTIAGHKCYIDRLKLLINNSQINILDINLSNQVFEAVNTSIINIDTKSNILKGNVDISKISLYKDRNNIENLQSSIFIDLNKPFIKLKDLKVDIDLSKKYPYIEAKDLSKLKLKVLFPDILNGFATINMNNKQYKIKALLRNQKTPLRYKDKPLSNIKLDIKYDKRKKIAHIKALNGNINIKASRNSADVRLNNIDVNISNMLQDSNQSNYNINILAKNPSIIIKDHILKFDSLKAHITKNNMTLSAKHKKAKITGSIKKKKEKRVINILGSNLSSSFLNQAIGKDIFNQGSFNLTIASEKKDIFYGTMESKNTYIKDISMFTNIFSILNVSPMGFSANGLKVDNGKILYELKKDKLLINPLSLYSDSVNIVGKGFIDIATKEMNLYVKTSILKTLSWTISNLPIINYIILGDEGDMNINMIIKGTMDNADISLDSSQDILKQPFEIILRTLTLPQKITKDLIGQ